MKLKYLTTILVTLIICVSTSAQTVQTSPSTTVQTQKQQTIKLKVSGITCSGDCKDIQKEVNKLNGIIAFKLLGKPAASSTFEITFDPAVVSEKEIRNKIEDTPGCEDPKDKPYKVKQ